MDLQLKRTLNAAPVQYEGAINGFSFYFRARHQEWFFGVGATLDAAIDADSEGGFFREGKWGHGPHEASYMPFSVAERIIQKCAMEYLATLAPEVGQ